MKFSLHLHRFSKSYQAELKEVGEEIKSEYIQREVSTKKQQVMDANKKVRWIMQNWLGVTTDEVFQGWRDCVDLKKKLQRREHRKELIEERLRNEDEMATYELNKLEVTYLMRNL